MTSARDEKDDRLLLHPIRRQSRLTERDKNPHRNQAIKRKALQTRVEFHADSNSVKIRHVSFGLLPCVRITSLKKDVYMATSAISDMLRQKESPTKGQRKVVQKDQLRYWRSPDNWVVDLKIRIRENLFYVNLENWNRNKPSNSPRAPGTKLKFAEERVHREELSKRVRTMSVVLARQNLGKDHMRTLHQERCARKAAWNLAKNIYQLKNSDKTTFYVPGEVKGMSTPSTSKRP